MNLSSLRWLKIYFESDFESGIGSKVVHLHVVVTILRLVFAMTGAHRIRSTFLYVFACLLLATNVHSQPISSSDLAALAEACAAAGVSTRDCACRDASGPVRCWGGRVRQLEWAGRQLRGSLSPRLGDLGALEMLAVNDNELRGSVPASLGRLTAMSIFLLYNNPLLGGTLPAAMANWTEVRTLFVNNCALRGPFPDTRLWRKIVHFGAHECQFVGAPPDMTSASLLEQFQIQNNVFSGAVPPVHADAPLDRFWTWGNDLSGSPREPKGVRDCILQDSSRATACRNRLDCSSVQNCRCRSAPTTSNADIEACAAALRRQPATDDAMVCERSMGLCMPAPSCDALPNTVARASSDCVGDERCCKVRECDVETTCAGCTAPHARLLCGWDTGAQRCTSLARCSSCSTTCENLPNSVVSPISTSTPIFSSASVDIDSGSQGRTTVGGSTASSDQLRVAPSSTTARTATIWVTVIGIAAGLFVCACVGAAIFLAHSSKRDVSVSSVSLQKSLDDKTRENDPSFATFASDDISSIGIASASPHGKITSAPLASGYDDVSSQLKPNSHVYESVNSCLGASDGAARPDCEYDVLSGSVVGRPADEYDAVRNSEMQLLESDSSE